MSLHNDRRQSQASPDNPSRNFPLRASGIFHNPYQSALFVFGLVLFFALIGLMTQPIGFLAALWPANAVLVGLFLRKPEAASMSGWLAAFAAYVIAELAWGGALGTTLSLTLANLAGVLTMFLVVNKLGTHVLALNRPFSMVYLFAVCVAGSIVAAAIGILTMPSILADQLWQGMGFWAATELSNYIIVLPLVLACWPEAPGEGLSTDQPRPLFSVNHKFKYYPFIALLVGLTMALLVGGPGALLFPVPALLWCALSYRIVTTAMMTFSVSAYVILSISLSAAQLPFAGDDLAALASVRLGVMCFALAGLTVANVNAIRVDLLRSLADAANYDGLTKALSRRTFMLRAERLITKLHKAQHPFCVIMLDVDDFKQVNDLYGHAVGDKVLTEVAATLQQGLRHEDLLGRLGGEEFGLVLAGISADVARSVADRLRTSIEDAVFTDELGRPFFVTISMGVEMHQVGQPVHNMEVLLSKADRALYSAKHEGKNRVSYA